MITSNFHTHSSFCDGKGVPEDYVREALKKGFTSLGFSGHTPIPVKNGWAIKDTDLYFKEIERLKKIYISEIDIYTGLEIDYFPGDDRNIFKKFSLDYTIGAIHFFMDLPNNRYYSIDGNMKEFEESLSVLFDNDIRLFVEAYYGLISEMVRNVKPDIVAHFDVLKKNNKNNKFYSENEKWYRDIVKKTLSVIAENNSIIEMNTGGIGRGYTEEPYPSGWILKECLSMGIPVMLNSDAHSPEKIDVYFKESCLILKEVGFTSQRIILKGKWTDVPI